MALIIRAKGRRKNNTKLIAWPDDTSLKRRANKTGPQNGNESEIVYFIHLGIKKS
jgi:hypothetical protein